MCIDLHRLWPAFASLLRHELQSRSRTRIRGASGRGRGRCFAARGEAAQIREDAAAYKNRVVEESKGEAQRFLSVYEQYAKAPEVTRKRLFLETMEDVFSRVDKIILDETTSGAGGQGIVPYLPLNELRRGSGEANQ